MSKTSSDIVQNADTDRAESTSEISAFSNAIILPSGTVTITECARELFGRIAPSKQMLIRGGAVMVPSRRDDGVNLEILRPAQARSFFERFGRLFVWRSGADGKPVLKPTVCPEEMANALLQTTEASTLLPRVAGLSNSPVIREDNDGDLSVSGLGYDDVTQLLITGGAEPPIIPLSEAVKRLLTLFDDYDFQTPGDKARAIASLISPALKMGGLLSGRVPADVAEADQSQAGKTYRQKLIAAVYNEQVALVTNRAGGVGSTDETFNAQLVAGRPFIQFDNFRGRFESEHLEAFLTADGSFGCRVPYRGEISVQPDKVFIFLTSNGVNTTRDFANRSNIIRIRKRSSGYRFRSFSEGDLLAHVRKNQALFLGCIFSVVREWHSAGKPRTDETRHDYRGWVQVVDWICRHLFATAPVMDGHLEAQDHVSDPALIWLRALVLAAVKHDQTGRELTACDIFELCETASIVVPGLRRDGDVDRAPKVIGGIMARQFKAGDVLRVDGRTITRSERYLPRDNNAGSFKGKVYTIEKA